MKKICFITPNFFPVPAVKGGAVETLVEEIINENEKYGKLDITCYSIFDEKAFNESQKLKKAKIIFIKNKIKYKFKFIEKVIDYLFIKFLKTDFSNYLYKKNIYTSLRKNKFDYVIIEGGNPLYYYNLIKKIKNKKISQKIYLHIHGVMQGSKELNDLYDGFISISEFVTSELTKNNIIPKEKVYLVENAIDVERFSQEIIEFDKYLYREKYNIKKNDIVIMFLGRLVPEKGIKETIQAFKNINCLNKCKLLVVGNSEFANNAKSEFETELYELSKEIGEKIIFTGYVPNKEIYKLHKISDIFVAPSLCEEAFGLAIVEAMASGLPIISTDSGAIPDITKGECAYILKRDDNLIDNISKAINLLANDIEERDRMKKSGKKIAQKYSLQNLYINFVQALQEE